VRGGGWGRVEGSVCLCVVLMWGGEAGNEGGENKGGLFLEIFFGLELVVL